MTSSAFLEALNYDPNYRYEQKWQNRERKVLLSSYSFQQTTSYTCGPASVISLFHYYGIKVDEMTLAQEMGTRPISAEEPSPGTSPEEMESWLENNGFSVILNEYHRNDGGGIEIIRNSIEAGIPVLVEWIDWGGHWVLVVGYIYGENPDGSEDKVILADPMAASHGFSNGLVYFNAERFDSMWFDALLGNRIRRRIHLIATPKTYFFFGNE